MHSRSNLLGVKWLGLSVTIRVRVRAGDREWISFFSFSLLKSDEHLCLALLA